MQNMQVYIIRENGYEESLVYIDRIHPIEVYMKSIGILPGQTKLITINILKSIEKVLGKETFELQEFVECIDNEVSDDLKEQLEEYKSALYFITMAIYNIEKTRKFGEAIMYSSTL